MDVTLGLSVSVNLSNNQEQGPNTKGHILQMALDRQPLKLCCKHYSSPISNLKTSASNNAAHGKTSSTHFYLENHPTRTASLAVWDDPYSQLITDCKSIMISKYLDVNRTNPSIGSSTNCNILSAT